MKTFAFIINPISGHGNHSVEETVRKFLNKHPEVSGEINHTHAPGEATQIAADALKRDLIPIAIGGDGTVNEVAKSVIQSGKPMGIIPRGSGNGIARHLGIPLHLNQALENLILGEVITIDTGLLNEHPFVMLTGVGFDAEIAYKMSISPTRGLKTYAKLVLKEWRKFKPVELEMEVDGKPKTESGFMFSFANASQFGNNFYIAPQASMKDGLIDVAILKPFPLTAALSIAYRMVAKTIGNSKYMELMKAKSIRVKTPQGVVNIDGEAVAINNTLNIQIQPQSLQVIAPKGGLY